MPADRTAADQRLALLLAGGGVRVRRLLATASPGTWAFDHLCRNHAVKVTENARRLLAQTVPATLERAAALAWRWIIPEDDEFPSLLRQISDPPLGLFVRGRLPLRPAATIVGSRRATAYGRQVARLLGEELCRAGVAVVSGMARGVDGAAHEGAVEGGGPTVAIWGAGPDRVYPPEHHELAERIVAVGAALTEYPPGTPPRRHHFPERNRLLAGFSAAVVVVEAAARSGALATARLAVDEGREVLAVPGNIFAEQSIGPNALLRAGARPLLTPRDVLDLLPDVESAGPDRGVLNDAPEGLLGLLPRGEAMTPDELAGRAEQSVGEILAELLDLELRGQVERGADGRYSRR